MSGTHGPRSAARRCVPRPLQCQSVSKLRGLTYYRAFIALVSIAELTTAMGHIQGANRHEEIQFPPRLDDYITDDNPVRFIDVFVDALDLEARGFRHAVAAATGRPSYHPGDLLKLYIYGYLYRLRSSRRLEQETQRNVERMWLLKKLRPDHKTIANFRRDHLKPLREVCRALTLLCNQLDLFGGELVAIDGRKFRAVNAKGRHVTTAKREKVIAQIDERVEGYLKELEAADDQDEAGTPGGARSRSADQDRGAARAAAALRGPTDGVGAQGPRPALAD
jgi:transposase